MTKTEDSNYFDQLMMLKGMTVRLGVIHEAQRLQLCNYLWALSDVKDKYSVEIDVLSHKVVYKCKKKPKISENDKEVFSNIVKWVRTILWDDTAVYVMSRNKEILASG